MPESLSRMHTVGVSLSRPEFQQLSVRATPSGERHCLREFDVASPERDAISAYHGRWFGGQDMFIVAIFKEPTAPLAASNLRLPPHLPRIKA